MRKTARPGSIGWVLWLTLLLLAQPACAADLTDLEQRWVRGLWPVFSFGKAAGLPLDLVVQPQPAAGEAPLALAYVDGRCKLVLTMRGNAEASATLARVPGPMVDAAIELMAAHELGHCRRHVDGAWLATPSGFAPRLPDGLPAPVRAAYLEMQAQRREEAYADLVGLAWTRQRHPEDYAQLHAWLVAERSTDLIEGSHHDTLDWIRTAADPGALRAPATIFAAAAALWVSAARGADAPARAAR